jgi:hypothetical protein
LPKRTEIWWEASMEGSVLSFLKAEWKVSDTGSATEPLVLEALIIWQFSDIYLAKRLQRKSCFRNQPIRNKNCLWRPCMLTDQNEMSNSHWLISKKSSPLKPLFQMNRHLVGSIYGRFSIKIANFVPIH